MKNFVKLLFITSILIVSCNKDDEPTPKPVDTRLPLPAVLENNIYQVIKDATVTAGGIHEPGSIESNITIDKDGIVANPSKIFIEIDLEHPWCGEIVVELITPNGQSCGLIKRLGVSTENPVGSDFNFIAGNKLVFNASNTNLIEYGPNIPAGNYTPTNNATNFPINIPMISLNTFLTSKNIKGIWKLKVYDYKYGSIGLLNSWKLTLERGALQ